MPATNARRLESSKEHVWTCSDAEAAQFVRVALKPAPVLPDALARAEFRYSQPEGRNLADLNFDLSPMIAAQRTQNALATNAPADHAKAAWAHLAAASNARRQAGKRYFAADIRAWLKRRAAFHLRATAHHTHFAIWHGH